MTRVRRRHRHWMRAMTLATAGWAVVWGSLWLSKLGLYEAPERWVYTLGAMPAALGLAYSVASLRVRPAWMFMAAVAVFANGSLLALPFLFGPEFSAALTR